MRDKTQGIVLTAVLVVALWLFVGNAFAQRNLAPSHSASPAQRVALVIGNDNYTRIKKLDNARADARAMARALEQAGFDVTLRLDLGRSALLEAVRNLKLRLSGGSEAVFYFAGHGVQLGAANYLLPVDIIASNEEQVKDDGLPLQRVLDDITEQKARFSLAIIDACRDNPFPRVAGRSIGTTRGLAPTTAATGQMVLYSAGTGQTALDRLNAADRNPNGLFTRVFLQEMQEPGVPVDRVLRNVRDQVVAMAKSVGHEQVPALYDQAIGEFYFRPPAGGTQVASVVPAPPPPVDPSANDRAFWDSVKGSQNIEEFKAYLDRFPSGIFVSLAQSRIRALQSSVRAPNSPLVAQSTPSERPSALSYGAATGFVKKGVTTQIELMELFGGPSVMTTDKEGTEIWMYDKTTSTVSGTAAQSGSQAVQSEASSLAAFLGIPFLGGVAGGRGSTHTQSGQASQSANTTTRSVKTITFIIKFNQDKTVKDYSVRQASY